jgi:lipoprotein signal peptidase
LPETWRGKNATTGFAVSLGLIVLFLMLAPGLRFLNVLGLSLFCGGSLSNLIDRMTLAGVVDFLIFGLPGLRPYIFNLADVAIGAGIITLVSTNFMHFVKGSYSKFIARA